MKGVAVPVAPGNAVEALPEGSVDCESAAGLMARPELRLWLRLLSCSTLIQSRLRGRLRAEFATTAPRFDLMAQLDTAPQGLTMGELSKRLMVTNGNITALIERLAREGLVSRSSLPADRRSHCVRLTAAGGKAYREMAAAHESWLADMMDGLGRDDVAHLMSLLARLKGSARQAGAGG